VKAVAEIIFSVPTLLVVVNIIKVAGNPAVFDELQKSWGDLGPQVELLFVANAGLDAMTGPGHVRPGVFLGNRFHKVPGGRAERPKDRQ